VGTSARGIAPNVRGWGDGLGAPRVVLGLGRHRSGDLPISSCLPAVAADFPSFLGWIGEATEYLARQHTFPGISAASLTRRSGFKAPGADSSRPSPPPMV